MYPQTTCPSCEGEDLHAFPALLSPFIARYVMNCPPRPSWLMHCRSCGFRFFAERFTADEAARLYDGYRGPRYYHARRREEPWYTEALNAGFERDPAAIAARKAAVFSFLREAGAGPVDRVLDYGGDRGQFIPEALGQQRFVYDISGVDTVDGVIGLRQPEALAPGFFDLVMLSHVLEHCSDLDGVLAQVRGMVRGAGHLFVEVPLERPNLRAIPTTGRLAAAYARYLGALCRAPLLLKAVDFYSSAARIKLNTVPPGGFIKLHEHINFFTVTSLTRILERAGCRVIRCEVVRG
ncbi:MAG TPA: methyltransferase domain-containing protein, partial [Myxococcota bacterium]|nr:methyltransferase domain-containing protein [Myxococcota bacterium]